MAGIRAGRDREILDVVLRLVLADPGFDERNLTLAVRAPVREKHHDLWLSVRSDRHGSAVEALAFQCGGLGALRLVDRLTALVRVLRWKRVSCDRDGLVLR